MRIRFEHRVHGQNEPDVDNCSICNIGWKITQKTGKRTCYVPQTADLDEGLGFRCHKQDVQIFRHGRNSTTKGRSADRPFAKADMAAAAYSRWFCTAFERTGNAWGLDAIDPAKIRYTVRNKILPPRSQ